jgi:hypothetical protein
VEGNRLTLERQSGSFHSDGRVKGLEPAANIYEWRPAIGLGTKQQMLVIRESPAQEWEGFFRR